MYRGFVVRKYEQGQQIEVVVDVNFLICILCQFLFLTQIYKKDHS